MEDGRTEPRMQETRRIARVLKIVQLISSQPRRWTRAGLSEWFEVSERMIDNDLALVRNGLCYELHRARDGYYFVDGPFLKPVELTVPEALALALAAQQARDTGAVDTAVIAGALARLQAALPSGIVPYLMHAGDAMPIPFGPSSERGVTLTVLRRAMAEGRTVEMVYATASRGGSRSCRTIAPYYLQPYDRSWMVIARDNLRGTVLMFKVDRIERCALTAERYSIPKNFNPVTYLGSAWGVLRGEASPAEQVALRFTAQAGRWVCDERWHPSQTTEWLPDGDLMVRFHCGVTHELVRWVLSFGGEVYVESPGTLRDMVRAEAERLLQRGSDTPCAP